MLRSHAWLFTLVPLVAFAGCFPDFAVGESAGDAGSSGDGGGDDATTSGDGGGSRDGAADAATHDASSDSSSFDAGASSVVPQGQFVFTSPGGGAMTTATISHDMYFDTTELKVSTLRAWVAAAKPSPCATGTCTLDPGGPYASSIVWYSSWNQNVAAEHYKDTSCSDLGYSFANYPTYNGTDDAVPVNCVNWYQAAALCWFDGQKRLATQVEWQYAASGRGRGRTYPWGDTPVPSDCALAIWRSDAGSMDNYNGCHFPIAVGSAPMGASFDGVLDMAGSVAEWTWDWYDTTYPSQWPTDYAGPAEDAGSNYDKMVRGGNWDSPDSELHTNAIRPVTPDSFYGDVGVRCVKTKL